MLECGFLSRFWAWIFGLWHVAFSEARRQGFSLGAPPSSRPSSVKVFSQ